MYVSIWNNKLYHASQVIIQSCNLLSYGLVLQRRQYLGSQARGDRLEFKIIGDFLLLPTQLFRHHKHTSTRMWEFKNEINTALFLFAFWFFVSTIQTSNITLKKALVYKIKKKIKLDIVMWIKEQKGPGEKRGLANTEHGPGKEWQYSTGLLIACHSCIYSCHMNYDRNCVQYILLENQRANIAKHRKYVLPVLTLFCLVPRAIKKKLLVSFLCLLLSSSLFFTERRGRGKKVKRWNFFVPHLRNELILPTPFS